MKTIEELENEYNQYQVGNNEVDNYEDFYDSTNMTIESIIDNLSDTFTQTQENNKWKKISTFRNLLPIVSVKEDVSFYDYDNRILLEASDLLVHALEYCERIREVANNDNYLELNKLFNFLLDNYEDNINYLNDVRNNMTAEYVSEEFINSEFSRNLLEIHVFADKHISSYEPKKQYIRR